LFILLNTPKAQNFQTVEQSTINKSKKIKEISSITEILSSKMVGKEGTRRSTRVLDKINEKAENITKDPFETMMNEMLDACASPQLPPWFQPLLDQEQSASVIRTANVSEGENFFIKAWNDFVDENK
jgi:hypothetical protein